MKVGIPREIKENENRVALTPAGVIELCRHGHTVLVEAAAGANIHISDDDYRRAGAEIVPTAAEAYAADLVVKVKEPVETEFAYLRADQTLFCFLHLAAAPALTAALVGAGPTAIGYETVELDDGRLPLLAPMSEVAGRLAPQAGATHLEAVRGGRGVLLGGVAGVPPAKVTVIGGGIVGANAALIALGMGATVTLIDLDIDRLRYLEEILIGRVATRAANTANIAEAVIDSDLVIGAVLIHGAPAPKLVTKEIVQGMRPGSVIVDVAVDQGGCVETITPTTHSRPTTIVHGILHYGVTNMPSAVPLTSTYALTNSTLPWVIELANKGPGGAVADNPALKRGLNVVDGRIVHPGLL